MEATSRSKVVQIIKGNYCKTETIYANFSMYIDIN